MALPVIGLTACALLWPAMLTFHAGDWPSPHQYPHNSPAANLCGPVGAFVAYMLRYYLGDGAYPLLLFATLAAGMKLVRGQIGYMAERVFGLILFVACTSASAHLVASPATADLPVGHGGVIGFALGDYLGQHLRVLGTIIILGSCLIVGLLFVTEGWVLKVPGMIMRVGRASGAAAVAARDLVSDEGLALLRIKPRTEEAADGAKKKSAAKLRSRLDEIEDDEDEAPGSARGARKRKAKTDPTAAPAVDEVETEEEEISAELEDAEEAAEEDDEQDDAVAEAEEVAAESPAVVTAPSPSTSDKLKALIVNFPKPPKPSKVEAYPKQIEDWKLPDIALLCEPEYTFTAQQEVFVREQAQILEKTLEDFRLDTHVVEIDTGPVITMFELKLGKGIKVSQIGSLANDIARALKAHAIRVVAPIPGKNTVGIEVPNHEKEKVRMKELMTVAGKKASAMRLPLFLGKDASGACLVTDLTKMPHVLIAGTTGSGKSVCINSIIVSLMMTKRPDELKMILVDPKMVEMSQFKDVPHLMCPIVTDPARAEKILEWAVTKMDERYEILAEARVRAIAEYNNLGKDELYRRLQPASDEEKASINIQLPYIVIVIDELADLMMTSAKEVEHHLSRLAQKSRAVGIHIIVATQRPEAKVVTGLIKSNLPSRICFRVASRMDSRIVLDQNGGEVLMGQGDMLFLPPGSHKLLRAQGTFLEDDEVQAVLDDLASRAKPEFHPELVKIRTAETDGAGLGLRDPLFDKAVRVILESKRGSVSLLQRRLTIGYARASRLIEQMRDAGVVGEYKGSQASEVLITLDEWNSMQKQYEADLAAGYEADQEGFGSGEDADLPFDADDDDDGEVPAMSHDDDIRG
jgi:S-DNA-T family DNA segregation ATPase FtsK/SpoIIIE